MRDMKSSYDTITRRFVIDRSEWANGAMDGYNNREPGEGAFCCLASPDQDDKAFNFNRATELPQDFRSCCVGVFIQCAVPNVSTVSILGETSLCESGQALANPAVKIDHALAVWEMFRTGKEAPGWIFNENITRTRKRNKEISGLLSHIYNTNDEDHTPIDRIEEDLTSFWKKHLDIELVFQGSYNCKIYDEDDYIEDQLDSAEF